MTRDIYSTRSCVGDSLCRFTRFSSDRVDWRGAL